MVISASCSRARPQDQLPVERLGEARVGHRRPDAARARALSPAFRHSASRAPKDRIATPCPSSTIRPRPISSGTPALGHLDPDALAAREAEGARPVVDRGGGRHHVHELRLVRGRHHHEVRQAGEDRRRRRPRHGSARRRRRARRGRWRSAPAAAGSRRRAPPGRSRAAGRSSRSRRTASSPPPPCRRRRSRACCSAMPTSKERRGKRLAKRSRPGAVRHRRGHRDDPLVRLGLADQTTARRPWCRIGAFDGFFCCAPVTTSNFATPWYLSLDASAGG